MLSKNHKIAYLYLTITFCAWGSLYVVSRFVLGKVPVFTASFIRFVIAGLILNIVVKRRKPTKIDRKDYKLMFIIGFFGYFISMGAQFIGTKMSNASFASLINSMNPITISIFASLILKERLSVKSVICLILALVGVKIVIGDIGGNIYLIGILLSIFSVILWSIVSVLIKKLTIKYDPLLITLYGILIGGLFNLPIAIYEILTTPDIKFDWVIILSLLYMGIICTALAHVFWNKSLSLIEAHKCSLFYPIQPMVAAILGGFFLGESINKDFILGAILIIGGVVFNIISLGPVKVEE